MFLVMFICFFEELVLLAIAFGSSSKLSLYLSPLSERLGDLD